MELTALDLAFPEPSAALDAVDMAKHEPCPGCGADVRVFAHVMLGDEGETPCGPWWCPDCRRAKIDAALGAESG